MIDISVLDKTLNLNIFFCRVFAGTAVITNYFLMITWLPASISIMERFTTCSKLQIQKLLIMVNKSINSFCSKLELFITTTILNYAPILFTLFGKFTERER